MEPNTKLAVVIPTLNRADYLDYFFELHVPRFREHNISVCISDCASTDNTAEIVKKWQQLYPLIEYSCTAEKVNADENAENAVNLSRTEYTWLMGDTYEIPKKSLDFILDTLDNGTETYDVITLNHVGRIRDIPQKIYTECNDVLADLAWMQACVSTNIYHRKLIENGDQKQYSGSNFCQLGFILDYISRREFKLLWAQSVTVETLKHPTLRKQGWGLDFFPIMFGSWPEFIAKLPEKYDPQCRLKALKSLPVRTKLLGWRNVLHLRGAGFLNKEIYSEYHHRFDAVAPKSFKKYAYFLTLLPQGLCKALITIIEWVRRKNYRIRNALTSKT